ncbi:acyl-ACP--UDP-N-acetylglucosamine O-acyltransferase [Alteromonas lipolytica]|uniref:Acyl-[acyl-carrier-protein]--UDP-N-acetylglucosamine O-acyltransferase n=1 Tax=Alteromonas lipolytica TaxID=1856405 RepID=A0A1E8FE94_9ALTE|nr:acyl-ACP--UDP-N-acetylglucosamine O-acyltransferase [Alteromonas lipolytica]OFI34239.1 acyl-[acyl-carrier-protein]--UDP-N-acetylglucosamine O-acyltransferase [Alteromonas lipolytica]GGF83812.1 acyl-[acyl-carrier-protein]--UDP-N-acetylglucosamine O-acyltransferase [Alteromonas lipolytica]
MIHETAVISPKAKLGNNVTVGPFSVIGDEVVIGDDCRIESHVVIKGPTRIGRGNHFYQFTSIGEDCQDKKYAGERTELIIGDNNVFREGATVHRGTIQDEGVTRIGSGNLIMVNAHIAHDCKIGNDIILANNVAVAGHVEIGDYAILGGATAVHQFCKIGPHSFTGGGAIVLRDIPPYVMISGTKHIPQGINSEGLRRRGYGKETIMAIRRAYKVIYRDNNTVEEAIKKLTVMADEHPEIGMLITFLAGSERGIVR